ncbi:MAG: XRE family transcriptional regulator [Planctomycetota bacterium]|nr:MAG: XRE family transcriptional regulator [Planctomycetota bacterium]REK39339.1 MAG: XRE family transcriptional regulator [Planctomycetota bacterium]
MMAKHTHRKTKRTAAEKARDDAVREKFQDWRPTLDELRQNPDYADLTLGEYLEAKAIAKALKQAREEAAMSLREVAAATGIDFAMISRLENGVRENTSISTLNRLAGAYGKKFVFRLEDQV